MSPVAQQIVKHARINLGVIAGGSCLATLLINKCTSITTIRELPVNTLAKIGLVFGLTMFIDNSIGTLLEAKYKKDKKTCVYSQAISNFLFSSIRVLAMYKLNISSGKKVIFMAALNSAVLGFTAYKKLNP